MGNIGPLLPSSSDRFEHALAAGMSDDLPVPYDEIMDPYRTPERFLPWLAAHHSVDLWFEDWPTERKREMIAQCAGVSTVYPNDPPLGEMKGTFKGLERYLDFVDATVRHRVAHPSRFIFGKAILTQTPISHPPFMAKYLIRVGLTAPQGFFQIGRSAFSRRYLRGVDLEPIRRAKLAAAISKTPDTEYTISFAWRRGITFQDNIPIDGSHIFGGFRDRLRLG